MKSFPRALPLIASVLGGIFAPPPPLVPSSWAAANLVVPDGPRAGSRWDASLTPYVPEIIDSLAPDTPHNMVAVRKSAQTGVSVAAIALVGSYIDLAPCRIGFALPTIDAIQEFNREKLGPAIASTPTLRRKVAAQTSRSATGSTTTSKPFPGGSLVLINANSAPDLRAKTLKVGIGDEVDEWADDLDGQGDPWHLFLGRFVSFHASGDYKLFALSTPTKLDFSRIDRLYKDGDQRLWHVTCPGCGDEFSLEFRSLKFERRPPYKAHYVTPCCGTIVEHHEKASLVRRGQFKPTNPEGLYPSFHVDALISQLETWDEIAKAWWDAQGDERKLQSFYNLILGLPYEMRGDAPDHERLMERREDYQENTIPPQGLLLVSGADVQHTGIWVEVVAYAADRQSWSLTYRFLEGDTTDPQRGAFALLAEVYDEQFADAFGGHRRLDAMAVDAGDGGRANQVYSWCRSRAQAFAVKGMPGWTYPAIGTPTRVDITLAGKRKRKGATLWPVGTWSLKGLFYADLRKAGKAAGQEIDPPGYCHFGSFLTESYFRQITAEYLADENFRGRRRKVWKQAGENHGLDCRVYATAMAEYLGLTRLTGEQWAELARVRGVPEDLRNPDLFAPDSVKMAASAPAKTPGAATKPQRKRFARLKNRKGK